MKRTLIFLLATLALTVTAVAQTPTGASEASSQSKTLLVLPFENASKAPGLDWLGEAFVEVLGQQMASPALYPIARQDRAYAFDRSGLPTNVKLSRATLFRIGEQMDADYMVLGWYTYDGQTFTGTAQLLDVRRLHLSEEINESGPLVQVLQIQQALSWDLLKAMNTPMLAGREQFLAKSPSIRLDAFENYIRGVVTTSRPEKIKRFKEALRIDPKYTMATMQLAKEYFTAREYDSAAVWFSKVPKDAPESREANFYAGLSYYYLAQYERAATAFSFLAEQFPLTEVYNNLGVVEARRSRKDALGFFQKAAEADPSDADYRFNLGLAMYRAGDAASAVKELKEAVRLRPDDIEAKSLFDQVSASATVDSLPTPAADLIAQGAQNSRIRLPFERIKRNYDESSFRQLALEIQNATELRLAKTGPKEHAAYHIEHGSDLLSHGFTAEAREELREAVQLDPASAVGHAALAEALENTPNTATEARIEANTALNLEPSLKAYLVLARLDLRDNRLESAAKNVDHALAIEPESEAALELKRTIAAKLAGRAQPLP